MVKSSFQTPSSVDVATVTADEMQAVDHIAVEDVGIELLQMMENAGRILASHIFNVGDSSAIVVAGSGGNGGGGLVCARHLANHDVEVEVVLDRTPDKLTGVIAQQYHILDKMGVPVSAEPDAVATATESAVVVDALIGYGLTGKIRKPAETFIQLMNQCGGPVVSLDVPSGLDATTGKALNTAVDPDRIVTLALPKTGLEGQEEPLYLADISIPRIVYEQLNIEYNNPFGPCSWVELLQ